MFAGDAMLMDLGASPRRIQFDVAPAATDCSAINTSCTLRNQELFNVDVDNPSQPFAAVDTPVPIANNIVLMKVQYGIADPATGFIQKWVKATNDGGEDWSATAVLTTKTYTDLSRIKAVRIALIVRSETYDKCAYADVCPGATTNTFSYTLFSRLRQHRLSRAHHRHDRSDARRRQFPLSRLRNGRSAAQRRVEHPQGGLTMHMRIPFSQHRPASTSAASRCSWR